MPNETDYRQMSGQTLTQKRQRDSHRHLDKTQDGHTLTDQLSPDDSVNTEADDDKEITDNWVGRH